MLSSHSRDNQAVGEQKSRVLSLSHTEHLCVRAKPYPQHVCVLMAVLCSCLQRPGYMAGTQQPVNKKLKSSKAIVRLLTQYIRGRAGVGRQKYGYSCEYLKQFVLMLLSVNYYIIFHKYKCTFAHMYVYIYNTYIFLSVYIHIHLISPTVLGSFEHFLMPLFWGLIFNISVTLQQLVLWFAMQWTFLNWA